MSVYSCGIEESKLVSLGNGQISIKFTSVENRPWIGIGSTVSFACNIDTICNKRWRDQLRPLDCTSLRFQLPWITVARLVRIAKTTQSEGANRGSGRGAGMATVLTPTGTRRRASGITWYAQWVGRLGGSEDLVAVARAPITSTAIDIGPTPDYKSRNQHDEIPKGESALLYNKSYFRVFYRYQRDTTFR